MADDTWPNAGTKREYLEREAAKTDPLRHKRPTHGEEGEHLPNTRMIVWRGDRPCPIIAPICGTCGGEIDKIDGQWWHVRDLPPALAVLHDTIRDALDAGVQVDDLLAADIPLADIRAAQEGDDERG